MRHTISACAILGLLSLSPGCFLMGNPGVFIKGEDVAFEPPSGQGFRSGGETGDVWELSRDTAVEVNTWVSETVEVVAAVATYLNRYPATRTDGAWRIYGPYTEDDDRDLAWIIKLAGEESSGAYEVYLGPRGTRKVADMDLLMAGDLVVDGGVRAGGFFIDFDVIDKHAFLKVENPDANYGGTIEVTFERDVDTDRKRVELDYADFWVQDGNEDRYYSDEAYVFDRQADGSGTFRLAVWSTFAQQSWSGPETERMDLALAWNPQEEGRARGTIVEENGMGDLVHGDLRIDECFAGDGALTFRTINEAYAAELPDYNLGDESSCVLNEFDLP